MFALLTEWFTGQPGWTVLVALVLPPLTAALLFGRARRGQDAPHQTEANPSPTFESVPVDEVSVGMDDSQTDIAPGELEELEHFEAELPPPLAEEGRAPAPPSAEIAIEAPASAPAPSLASRLARTSEALVGRLGTLVAGRKVDAEVLEDLEALLFGADLGVRTADALLEAVRERAAGKGAGDVRAVLREEIEKRVARVAPTLRGLDASGSPHVILVLGVNGSGKTTTIGKLAARYAREGKRVVLGAGDTFRAAASDQLEVWADRVGCELVKGQSGGDPAAVAFDTVKAATARGAEVAIVDTAGRLQTKEPLIDELRKIARVIGRGCEGAPHETLLVLDANTGQNAISQARVFTEAVGVTGIVLTKLDGTAKGGVLVGLADEFGIPVRYVGVGEGIDDLRDFDADEFVEALFAQ